MKIITLKEHGSSFSILLIFMLFGSMNAFAQATEWKTGNADGGRIAIQYRISEQAGGNGDAEPLIEFITTCTDSLSLRNFIVTMLDISKHRLFLGADSSKIIETLSKNEWLVYYYFKAAGPFSASDCVAKMTYTENVAEKIATIVLTAAPEQYPATGAKRFARYDRTYTCKDLGSGLSEITISSKMSPAFKVPLWMIRAGFPGAASDAMRKFVKLAKES